MGHGGRYCCACSTLRGRHGSRLMRWRRRCGKKELRLGGIYNRRTWPGSACPSTYEGLDWQECSAGLPAVHHCTRQPRALFLPTRGHPHATWSGGRDSRARCGGGSNGSERGGCRRRYECSHAQSSAMCVINVFIVVEWVTRCSRSRRGDRGRRCKLSGSHALGGANVRFISPPAPR